MELRQYQQGSVEDLRGLYRSGVKRPLLVSPTGSGKTVLFVYITRGAVQRGLRVMILTHRAEILGQICRTLTEWGVPHCTLTAGRRIPTGYRVMVASVQTLCRRMEGSHEPDLVVIDEAHHSCAGSWVKVFAHYPNAKYLGVTATPERLDGRGLGEFYSDIVMGPRVAWLIENGFLSRPRYFSPPKILDVSSIKKTAGDFNRKAAAGAVDKPSITGDAVEHYKRLAAGRTAIAFCVSIAHAEHVCEQFKAAGVPAEVIDGTMNDEQRNAIIDRLRSRVTLVLVSVDLVSEGFDLPAVGAVILLRPTASLALHLQQVGRGLRPSPGKVDTVVLDHVGNCTRHGLAEEDRAWSLEGFSAKKRKKEEVLETKQCPACFAIHAGPVCPECGTVRKKPLRKLEQKDGILQEITKEMIREKIAGPDLEDCVTLADFQRYASRNQYKPGWAWHAFQRSLANRRKKKAEGKKLEQRNHNNEQSQPSLIPTSSFDSTSEIRLLRSEHSPA